MAYAMAPTVIEYVKSQMMQIAAYAHRDPEELLIVLMAPIMQHRANSMNWPVT